MSDEKKRIRDPIHGLILFDLGNEVDRLAWELIQTPDFQRLRRIRQLGLSDLVFPGATHSRFAHSVGVFHNARKLVKVIEREQQEDFNEHRACVVQIAALLHDLGHGPFSHAFEDARKAVAKARGEKAVLRHEDITRELILAEDNEIRQILDKKGNTFAQDIADVIAAEDPVDIYHAVVSSSFDADRLDYLVRDRYMTGTGAGAIDQDWLLDNLTTCEISIEQDNESRRIPTFVFRAKARQAAEDFLLARHRLYTQVYLHHATRGFEKLATALFVHISENSSSLELIGLDPSNPIVRFLAAEAFSLGDYRRLDDAVVWSMIEAMTHCTDTRSCDLAKRLLYRRRLKVIDVAGEYGHCKEELSNAERRLDRHVMTRLDKSVFKDRPSVSLYATIGGDAEREHKKVRVLDGHGEQREITEFEDTAIGKTIAPPRHVPRFYFLDEGEIGAAVKAMKGS